MRPHFNNQRGFVALMSAVVMSAAILSLMFGTGTSSFYARFDSLNGEFKRVALGLSESCSNAALLKIAQNYNYQPPVGGEAVTVGPDTCLIKSVTYGAEDPLTHRKLATINTNAQYPLTSGAWSTTQVAATVQNPAASVVAPPPTCTVQASPPSIPAGQQITVQWAASSNAVSFSLTPTPSPAVSNPAEAQSGSRTYTASGSGAVTYTGIAYNSSGTGSTPCTATVNVTPPPPAPSCADTVMMFDRSGSMSSTDLNNEKAAANAIIDLYSSVAAAPKVGAGSFGGYPNGGGNLASIPTSPNGQLQNAYATLKSTINTFLGSNSSVGSHLSNAIAAAQAELTSVRATAPKKVLVFVSDGEPTDTTSAVLDAADTAKLAGVQIFTVRYSQDNDAAARTLMAQIASGNVPFPASDTGTLAPTSNQHSAGDSGVAWTNPQNAYGAGVATTINTTNSQQRYYNFNIPAIPAGSTINDVIVKANASFADAALATTSKPVSVGNFNTWTGSPANTNAGKVTAIASNDNDTSYVTTTVQNNAQTFLPMNSGIPATALVNSVTVNVVGRSSSGSPSMKIRVEKVAGGASQSDGPTVNPGGSYTTYTRNLATNPFTGLAWTTAEVNAWTTSFGIIKTSSSGTLRVTQISVTVNYTLPSTDCRLGVDLSWNGGGTWSSEQTWTLPTAAVTHTFNSAGNWGAHAWAVGDFTNANFRVRVHGIDPGATCDNAALTNLDTLQAEVLYGSTHQPGSADDQATNALENADGDNFFITPLTATEMSNIFTTIGQKVCPAAAPACSNTIDDDTDGFIDAADPSCHTDGNASNAASYDPTINSEWTAPTPPPPPAPPPPPPPVSIGSWDEVISPAP